MCYHSSLADIGFVLFIVFLLVLVIRGHMGLISPYLWCDCPFGALFQQELCFLALARTVFVGTSTVWSEMCGNSKFCNLSQENGVVFVHLDMDK